MVRVKAKFKAFLFVCVSMYVFLNCIYLIISLLYNKGGVNLRDISQCLFLSKWNWFIKAYICLYFFSPVLNKFTESTDRRTFRNLLIGYFAFQSIYGWLTTAAGFFVFGYSTLSFMGLYLLSRYIRIYSPRCSQYRARTYLAIYLLSTLAIAAELFIVITCQVFSIDKVLAYTNPLVIVSALSLLLCFNRIHFSSRLVNWCGASCFAVYLLHTNPHIIETVFKASIVNIASKQETYLAEFLQRKQFLIAVFIVAILIDQIRILIWNVLQKQTKKILNDR